MEDYRRLVRQCLEEMAFISACSPTSSWCLDLCGVPLPLSLATIDRIDSTKGYEPGNVRLLLWGFGHLQSNARGDKAIAKHIVNLRANLKQSHVAHLAGGHMPGEGAIKRAVEEGLIDAVDWAARDDEEGDDSAGDDDIEVIRADLQRVVERDTVVLKVEEDDDEEMSDDRGRSEVATSSDTAKAPLAVASWVARGATHRTRVCVKAPSLPRLRRLARQHQVSLSSPPAASSVSPLWLLLLAVVSATLDVTSLTARMTTGTTTRGRRLRSWRSFEVLRANPIGTRMMAT